MPSPLVDKTWQSSTLLLDGPPAVTKVDMASPLVDKTLQRKYTLADGPPQKTPHTHTHTSYSYVIVN